MANTHSLDLELSSSQYAYHADATAFDVIGDISFEAWVKLEQLPSTATTAFQILSKYDTAGGQRSYFCQIISATDKLEFAYYSQLDGSVYTIFVSDAAFFVSGDVGNWVHVAVTVNVAAKTCVMYKDLVSKANTESELGGGATSIVNGTANFAVGATHAGTSLFDGLIDEVRLWSDIRTSQELTDNWKTELVGNEANLNAYYKFNNDYTDSTSGGNTLTASGSPVFSTSVPFGQIAHSHFMRPMKYW